MISRGLLAKLASDASRLSTTQLPTICSGARSLAIFSKPLFSNISSRAQDVSRWDQSKSVRFYAAISTVKQSRATPRTSKGKATKTKATKSKRKTATTKSKGGRKKGAAKKKARGKGAKYSKKAKKIRKARKLTEKQKANAKFKKERAQLRHLKEEALKQPKKLPQTAWTVLLTETTKKGTPLAQSAKEAAQRYRTMSSSEREHYNHLANENAKKNEEVRQAWLAAHTPEEIRLANSARLHLRYIRHNQGDKHRHATRREVAIKDDRLVKRPKSSYIFFTMDRYSSGDFRSIALGDAGRLIGQEWRALDSAHKQPYMNQQKVDHDRYVQEYIRVYGHKPTVASGSASTSGGANANA